MRLSDIRKWKGRAGVVEWVDSGAGYDDPELEIEDMDLSVTHTTGIIVAIKRKPIYGYLAIIEQEVESSGFARKSHSGIWCRAILSISSKKPK